MDITGEYKEISGIPVVIYQKADACKKPEAVEKPEALKKPLVILSHGFRGGKESYVQNGCLAALAGLGYYAVAIDNRFHGDRPGPGFQEAVMNNTGRADLLKLRKAIKETADDIKRLIDALTENEEVDADRIALIGVSMGGFITYRAIVIDDRIKVGIPIISSPYWDDIPGDTPVELETGSQGEWDAYLESYQPANSPDRFYPVSLLMQVGDLDQHYDADKVQRFYETLKTTYRASPEKLKLIRYANTKHEFLPEMWNEALLWLKENL